MTPQPRDIGLQAVSTVTAFAVNGVIFAGMALAGLIGDDGPPPELPSVAVELLELPKLGQKPPDPTALPRIQEPKPPPPPPAEETSLSRELEEELERKKEEEERVKREEERKRKQEMERQRLEDEKRRREEAEARRRKRAMEAALNKATDPRADDEDAPGFENGVREGTSTNPESLRNKLVYLSRVEAALRSQFEVPSLVSKDLLERLEATVRFKIDKNGKVVGEPRLVKRSGNKLFDDAAMTAVRKFGPGSQLRIPLPLGDEDLKKIVLREGLRPTMHGRKL